MSRAQLRTWGWAAAAFAWALALIGTPSSGWAAGEARLVVKAAYTLMGDTPESGGQSGGFYARRHPGLRGVQGDLFQYPRLVVLRAMDIDLPPPASAEVSFDNEGYAIARPLIPVEDGQTVRFRNVLNQPITVDLREGEDGPVLRTYEVAAAGEAVLELDPVQTATSFRVREFAHMRTMLLPVNSPYWQIILGNAGEVRFPKVRPGKYKFATYAAGRWFSGRFRYAVEGNSSYLLEADLTGQLKQLTESLTQIEGSQNRQVRAEVDTSEPLPPPPSLTGEGRSPPGANPRPPPGGTGRPPPQRPPPRGNPPPGSATPPPAPAAPAAEEEEDDLEAGDLKVKTTGPGGIKITPKPK